MKTRFILPLATLAAITLLSTSGFSQVLFNGGTYSQNFDWTSNGGGAGQSVAWTSNAATQPIVAPGSFTGNSTGWYAGGTTQDSTNFLMGNGNDGGGNANLQVNNYYFGSGDVDRSFGGRPINGTPLTIAMRLNNNTGSTLAEFTLGYRLEVTQWRANGVQATASMSYLIGDPTNWRQDAFTSAASLNLTTVYSGAVETAVPNVNGNLAGNFSTLAPTTISGINWENGQDLWIRWTIGGNSSVAPNVGLDDVSFTAVPEPSSALLLGVGLAGLAYLRRRQKQS